MEAEGTLMKKVSPRPGESGLRYRPPVSFDDQLRHVQAPAMTKGRPPQAGGLPEDVVGFLLRETSAVVLAVTRNISPSERASSWIGYVRLPNLSAFASRFESTWRKRATSAVNSRSLSALEDRRDSRDGRSRNPMRPSEAPQPSRTSPLSRPPGSGSTTLGS